MRRAQVVVMMTIERGARAGGFSALSICGAAIAALCIAAAASSHTADQQSIATPRARVALTFDDLPAHGPLPPALSRVDIAKSILETLRRHNAPSVYGFINAKQVEDDAVNGEVLRLWRAAGFPLANHTFSHMDLHANSTDAFEQDVLANEPSLRSLMRDGDWRWFRFPYLREGNTPEKYRAVRVMLARHRYRVAQVTLSFDDYAYNEPYVRCLAQNNADGIAWLMQSYLDRASESLTRGQQAALTIFGREIDHVMLLHVGAFQTVMLPRLLDLLAQRGFALTTLDAAQADPAYAAVPERQDSWTGTFLGQMRASAVAPPSENVFPKLAELCRGSAQRSP